VIGFTRSRRTVAAILLLAGLAAFAGPALAGSAQQQTAAPGAVVSLLGTPHLWIADEQGVLHWGGDTRALAGKAINWGDRREATLDQLRSFRIGDPWLSAGLLKIGDPIYLVKWETSDASPTLLHIQSIADVELFGINGSNYGSFVLDQATWESRFRMTASGLSRGTLASAVPPTATPVPTATATPVAKLVARIVDVRHVDYAAGTVENEIEITGATPGRRLLVRAELTEWECSPACTSTRNDKWGPKETDRSADSTGRLIFIDSHFYYRGYTYYFEDPVTKATINVPFDDDRARFGLPSG
jgi:hypothetical protein